MFICVMALCLSLTSGSENAIQVVLGGSWFSKSSVGTSGNYVLSECKEKILNPLVKRVAQKVLENMEKLNELHWMVLALVLIYETLKSFQCQRQNL